MGVKFVPRQCGNPNCTEPVLCRTNRWRKYCDACIAAKVWETTGPSKLRKPCALCGTVKMTSPGSLPVGQYTCHECRRSDPEHREAIRAKIRARHAGDHRERARKFGVEYEPVNRRRVFDRDHWRCGICGLKVDRRLKHPDPMAASLDHVIPMARGGGHTYSNVQCSHLACNVRKGDRGAGEQLALIG